MSDGLHSAAYSQADLQLSRRIRLLEQQVADVASAVARLADAMAAAITALAPCPECQQVGTHLGTCSRSAMHGGLDLLQRRPGPLATYGHDHIREGFCWCGQYHLSTTFDTPPRPAA